MVLCPDNIFMCTFLYTMLVNLQKNLQKHQEFKTHWHHILLSYIIVRPFQVNIEFILSKNVRVLLSNNMGLVRGLSVWSVHANFCIEVWRCIFLKPYLTNHTFLFAVGDQMNMKSVVDYFKEIYGYIIQHSYRPCLQVGSQRKANYSLMETCKIVGGQRHTKKLNEKKITHLLKLTYQRPREQEMDILQTVHENCYEQDSYAKDFCINFSDKLVSVEAQVLPAPWLKYNDSGKEECLPQ